MQSVAQITHLAIFIEIGQEEFPVQTCDIEDYTVFAYYQPAAGRWIVEGGSDFFLLLSSDVMDALILEALEKGYPVRYVNSQGCAVRV